MNYYIEEDYKQVFVRRQFGHYDRVLLFSISMDTHQASILTDLEEFTTAELQEFHHKLMVYYKGNEEVMSILEDELISRYDRKPQAKHKLICRNNEWIMEEN